jgi:NAD(P)-dependent dehydrogenase (short-subunit alcohol dehydrogenase family)
MSPKVAVVTGSSSGMGYETSIILARIGTVLNVVLVCPRFLVKHCVIDNRTDNT